MLANKQKIFWNESGLRPPRRLRPTVDIQSKADAFAINGVFEDVRFGSGGPITDYGVVGENTIEVIASDTAGNASPPATTTLFLP